MKVWGSLYLKGPVSGAPSDALSVPADPCNPSLRSSCCSHLDADTSRLLVQQIDKKHFSFFFIPAATGFLNSPRLRVINLSVCLLFTVPPLCPASYLSTWCCCWVDDDCWVRNKSPPSEITKVSWSDRMKRGKKNPLVMTNTCSRWLITGVPEITSLKIFFFSSEMTK